MGDPIGVYIDSQAIEQGIYNGLVESLPDISPLHRAAWVIELQEVEKRLEALGHRFENRHFGGDTEGQEIGAAIEALRGRRRELIGVLWPAIATTTSETPDDCLAEGLRGRP